MSERHSLWLIEVKTDRDDPSDTVRWAWFKGTMHQAADYAIAVSGSEPRVDVTRKL